MTNGHATVTVLGHDTLQQGQSYAFTLQIENPETKMRAVVLLTPLESQPSREITLQKGLADLARELERAASKPDAIVWQI